MKTHLQLLITTLSAAALLSTSAAQAQEPDRRSQIAATATVAPRITCGLIYAVLPWFFAQRRDWAWITLTIFSFNPIAWIINFIYLRRRWAEDSVATATI
jgi:hypothetical protein